MVHRPDWLEFFSENDGIVLVHMTGMTKMPREYLLRQYQSTMFDPSAVLRQPPRQAQAAPRRRQSPEEQGELSLDDDAAT